MKIIALEAENVKRLKAVEIRPKGNLVEIAGKNGQGKTSVLDSIYWALAGTKNIQAVPIRKGATEARIRLDLGTLKVTRKFGRKGDTEYTTDLIVESVDGAYHRKPQQMLDALLGELTFDPLAFQRMKPADQFDALRRFVPDIEALDKLDDQNLADYDRRTEVNREAKRLRASASLIDLPENCPTERRDEAALVDEMQRAGDHNADLERQQFARLQERQGIDRERKDIADNDEEIRLLRTKIAQLEKENAGIAKWADEAEAKLSALRPLPSPIDTADLRQQIASARDHNELVAKAAEKARLDKAAADAEAQSEALTERMRQRDQEKQAAIAAAKLPVAGLGFGDKIITLGDVPFSQASDAEQLRASIAIAMASNPKLRVVRVRDGSLLDEDSMRLLTEMADANDCQVWVEVVGAGGPAAIVLEAGMVVKEPEPQTEGMLV